MGKSNESHGARPHYTGGQVDCDKLDKSLTESTPENTSEKNDKSSISSLSDKAEEEKPARLGIAPPLIPNVLQDSGHTIAHSPPGKFVAPTIQELTDYITSLGCADAENKAVEFFWKYESQDWLVGGSKMRSWRKMVAAWKKNWDATPNRAANTHTAPDESRHERLLAMVARSKKLRNGP